MMNDNNVLDCLDAIKRELMQDGYDEAFLLLDKLVCDAVRHGHEIATREWGRNPVAQW